MHATRRARHPLSAGLLAVVVALLAAPVAAAAEEPTAPAPTGRVVTGELVQAFEDPDLLVPRELGHAPDEDHADEDHAHGDHADEGSAGLLSWVQLPAGEAVRVPTGDVDHLTAGSTVEVVVGEPVADDPVAGLEPARDVLAVQEVAPPADPPPVTAPASGPVNHPVTVVMMLPPGTSPDGTTPAVVAAAVDGPVADFWEEQSDGRVQFGVERTWDWSPSTADCSRPFALWEEAAARAGWTGAPNAHLLVYVPATAPGCAAGLGTVGGGRVYVRTTTTSVIAHEFGHNLGLGHSSELQCDRTVEGGTCALLPYGDHYDVMGISWNEIGTLNSAQAHRLGLLPAGETVELTAQSPATPLTLVPVSSADGLRAVRLRSGSGVDYWVEYRQASGRDVWLGDLNRNWTDMQPGVTVRRSAPGPDDTSLVLDGSPSATGQWPSDRAMALPIGQPVALAGGRFTVTVRSTAAAGAQITVTGADAPAGDVLVADQELSGDRRLTSPDGRYRLVAQADGRLVLSAADGRVLWSSGVVAPGARTVLQTDGNLVTYATDGRAVWHSRTNGSGATRLVLQDDGNLVLYRADGSPVWWTGQDLPGQIRAGQQLTGGQSVASPNGRYRLSAQTDGNLVLSAADGRVLWHAGTHRNPGARTALQTDGNLVVYSSAGAPLWHARTNGSGVTRLAVQDDGNLVLYRADGSPVWWTGQDVFGELVGETRISNGQSVVSPSGRYRLVVQPDGNLVVHAEGSRVLWHAGTHGNPGARAVLQRDGNLVVYSSGGRALWNSRTNGSGAVRLAMQDDGNLVLYRSDRRPVWWTGQDPLR